MSDRKKEFNSSSDRRYANFDNERYDFEEDHYRDAAREWTDRMTKDERDAVEGYTGSLYRKMNTYLRDDKMGSGDDEDTERLITNAEKGISKFKFDEDTLVYRRSSDALLRSLGVSYDKEEFYRSVAAEKFVKEVSNFVGSIVSDKGFTSSSTRQNTWDGDVQYNIRVAKGTSAAYVDHISRHKGEREVVLNRGTRFRIIGARVEGSMPVVDIEILKGRNR